MFQMGGIGPMFGQIGFFKKFGGKDYEEKRPLTRYVDESRRLLDVLEGRLTGREWILGDQYNILEIATFPWWRHLKIRRGSGRDSGCSNGSICVGAGT